MSHAASATSFFQESRVDADSTSGSLVAAKHHAGRAFRQAHERMDRESSGTKMKHRDTRTLEKPQRARYKTSVRLIR